MIIKLVDEDNHVLIVAVSRDAGVAIVIRMDTPVLLDLAEKMLRGMGVSYLWTITVPHSEGYVDTGLSIWSRKL